MKLSDNERQTEIVQARVTPAELAFLDDQAARLAVTRSKLLRLALDQFIESRGGPAKGSSESGSKKRPAASTAKVKATTKRSPPRVHSSEQ